ncbi:MAG: ROK family protein [Anaerolineales bacterium]|nr:ROK family protein [Anaerolineales bacterium]
METLAAPGAAMDRLGRQAEDLFALVDSGEEDARLAAELMFRHLGVLVTNVHLLLDLELVVLTGGLASAGEGVRDGVREAFERLCPPAYQFDLAIRLGALPPNVVGVIGAASL